MLATLQDSTTTAVIDSLGAQLISLQDAGHREYIWQRDPAYWAKCSPLLFPIVGNCRNDKTIIEGTQYTIQKHGFCRESDFKAVFQDTTKVIFQLRENADTIQVYPYRFCLSLTYELRDGRLFMDYQVENLDNRTIWYCIGAHPGFNCPMDSHSSFEDYQLVFEREENTASITYDLEQMQFDPDRPGVTLSNSSVLPLKRELFANDAIYFDRIQSRKVSLIHKTEGHGIELSYPGFETVAFWTLCPAKAPFLCIEPWNGSGIYSTEDDEFTHKNHVQRLDAGKSRTYGMSIRILKRTPGNS